MGVKTFGFGQFLRFFEGVAGSFEAEAVGLVARTAFAVEADAKHACPVDTGRLKGSINTQFSRGGLVAVVGSNVKHAPFVEYGTGQRGREGYKPIVEGSEQPSFGEGRGQKPQPYLRPALHRHERQFARRANAIIKRHWDK